MKCLTLLCLGAGDNSEYFIDKALSMECKVIVVDGDKNAKCMLKKGVIAYHIDLKDREEILKIAKKYNIDAILPVPLGNVITTSGYINSKLNLKGISYEACLNFTDKSKANQIQKENNLNYPKQYQINEIDRIDFPCIIKPRNGSGSKGVKVVYTKDELLLNVQDDTIIEELVNGNEYAINGVVINNSFYLFPILMKRMTPYPYCQEVEYFGEELDSNLRLSIFEELDKNIKALKINNAFVNADIKVDKNGLVYVLDIAGRPGGNYLYYAMSLMGYDFADIYFNYILCGKKYNQKINNFKICLRLFDMTGKVVGFKDIDIEKLFIINNVRLNDVLGIVKDGRDISHRGCVIACADSVAIARERCDKYIQSIILEEM